MNVESRRNGREYVGQLFSHKDVIENLPFARQIVAENQKRGKIFAVNHFSLTDGPSVVANLCRIKEMECCEIGMPVTNYLLKYARWLNNHFELDITLTGVVTPSNVRNRKECKDRSGDGLATHMRISKSIMANHGAEVVFPQATRDKNGLGEPGPQNRVMEGLLRLNEKLDPIVIPVGLWVNGKDPKCLYLANPFRYHILFGEPKSTAEIKSEAEELMIDRGETKIKPFSGADAVVYGMIRVLLPENYR